ncbi:unnamed protein product [Ceratitis capitata]|uniref:(Mediterranean fruit fly) hypothetical protein n=1 Tax=Ceratitis capitata TaxID=7213 RepID=A0A811UFY4_CERCA|nr:unnamed protein product [Ceratitis capitata]
MRVVPVEHPMGPSVIALLLDDSPLPTKESVLKVGEMVAPKYEKLAGPSSIALLNNSMLKYLISNLNEDIEPNVKLLSLIALEKFAQTSENKVTIQKTLQDMKQSPSNIRRICVVNKFPATTNRILCLLVFGQLL